VWAVPSAKPSMLVLLLLLLVLVLRLLAML
jgi:hypothetical protein